MLSSISKLDNLELQRVNAAAARALAQLLGLPAPRLGMVSAPPGAAVPIGGDIGVLVAVPGQKLMCKEQAGACEPAGASLARGAPCQAPGKGASAMPRAGIAFPSLCSYSLSAAARESFCQARIRNHSS